MSIQVPDAPPQGTFEWTTAEAPSHTLVRTVSEVADADPAEMKPLYDVVDPESLDELFFPAPYRRAPPDGCVQFEYLDYVVVVKANGRGYVYDKETE